MTPAEELEALRTKVALLEATVKKQDATIAELLEVLRALSLHLMVRPHMRLPETEEGLKTMARTVIARAERL